MASCLRISAETLVNRLSTYHQNNFRKNDRKSLSPLFTATIFSIAGFSCTSESGIVCLQCRFCPDLDMVQDRIQHADVSITLILIIEHLKGSIKCPNSITCLEMYLSSIQKYTKSLKDIFELHESSHLSNSCSYNEDLTHKYMEKNAYSMFCQDSKIYDQLDFKVLEIKHNTKDMRNAKARLLTFKDWKFSCVVTPLALAYDGFYRSKDTVVNDAVKCVYCGIVLCSWENGDIVSKEHIEKSPTCPFKIGRVDKEVPFNEVEVYYHRCLMLFNDIAFVELLEKGSISNKELNDMLHLLDSKDNQMLTNEKIFAILSLDSNYQKRKSIEFDDIPWEKPQALPATKVKKKDMTPDEIQKAIATLREENMKLRETKLCKICIDKEINTVFLPCGHLVSCQGCAPKIRNCAVCRTLIRGTVLAFIPND